MKMAVAVVMVVLIPNTMTFAVRFVDPTTLLSVFFSGISAIKGTICFALDPFCLLCLKGLGFVLAAQIIRKEAPPSPSSPTGPLHHLQ